MEPFTIEVEAMASIHTHLREGDELVRDLVEMVIAGGVDVAGPMPNTKIPLTDVSRVLAYISRAKGLVPEGKHLSFIPIMQVTEQTTVEDILVAVAHGVVDFKVYPRYRTTKSEHGAIRYGLIVDIIKRAAKAVWDRFRVYIRVHFHPEHPSMEFGNRDAEWAFLAIAYMLIEETVAIVIWEHGTDARCIPHWKKLAKSGRFYVTLTAHHLATNEDKSYGDVRTVCKPSIKTEPDRLSLVDLVCEDHPWVIAAADDAPHDINDKHPDEGCCACGAYTAPFLLQLYAHALDGLLHRPGGVEVFIRFTSHNARRLYALPPATRTIKLVRTKYRIPVSYKLGSWIVQAFWAKQYLEYSLVE